jgi:hypothetical protein
MGTAEFGSECVTIGAAWTARDAGRVSTGKLGGGFPGSIVGHRTFDREDAAMVVGDDQGAGPARVRVAAAGESAKPGAVRGPAFPAGVMLSNQTVAIIAPCT